MIRIRVVDTGDLVLGDFQFSQVPTRGDRIVIPDSADPLSYEVETVQYWPQGTDAGRLQRPRGMVEVLVVVKPHRTIID